MNIPILTVGTRGDVQPYVALGKGLAARGHSVSIRTSVNFSAFVEDHGLGYPYLNDDVMRLMNSEEGKIAMENRRAGATDTTGRRRGQRCPIHRAVDQDQIRIGSSRIRDVNIPQAGSGRWGRERDHKSQLVVGQCNLAIAGEWHAGCQGRHQIERIAG